MIRSAYLMLATHRNINWRDCNVCKVLR